MGTITDFGSLVTDRKESRRGWGKAIISALVSAVLSVAGTTWKVRGYFDELEHTAKEQAATLQYLKEHLPAVEQIAIDARGDAQHTEKLLMAHLGGWPAGSVK